MRRFPRFVSIRARILAIAAIPGAVLLLSGAAASLYLINEGTAARNWATEVQAAIPADIEFIAQTQEERRLTLLVLGGDRQAAAALGEQRRHVDQALSDLGTSGEKLALINPAITEATGPQFVTAIAALPGIRQNTDAARLSRQDAYNYYNHLIELLGSSMRVVAQTAPDPATAVEESTAADLFDVLEAVSRSNAVAAGALGPGGLSPDDLREFRSLTASYHRQLPQLLPRLAAPERALYESLVASTAWQRLTTAETALVGGSTVSPADWQAAAHQVTTDLTTIWSRHHRYAQDSAAAEGQRTFDRSLFGLAAIVIVTAVTVLITVRVANRVIRRLKRLRAETLELAGTRLPRIVAKMHDGQEVDLAEDVPTLDYGEDEVGDVADAFNKAQLTAVAAAAQEAKTREGMNAVFLNIAHRSQLVVQRQLAVLDEAEGKQEDPAHLELLFRLDHLATRARRNAENLVILGGGRPGRKWRDPVPLEKIVRSAVSETEDYARIDALRLPDLALKGTAVADLTHLLAELVDNATSFSPPGSRVEVRGNIVGKGVAVEIEDRGLGIETPRRDELNALLRNPPDFQAMALSGKLRLGLFVVARLAARHDITVSLTESIYGGIRAIVVIPRDALAPEFPAPGPDRPATPAAAWPRETDLVDATAAPRPAPATPATGDARKPLPRRQRQAVQKRPPGADSRDPAPSPVRGVAPERARQNMAALVQGTRRGRSEPRHRS